MGWIVFGIVALIGILLFRASKGVTAQIDSSLTVTKETIDTEETDDEETSKVIVEDFENTLSNEDFVKKEESTDSGDTKVLKKKSTTRKRKNSKN